MICPPHGICLPVSVVRVIDGDTVLVARSGSDLHWAVRLLDCWAPEMHGDEAEQGAAAKQYLEQMVADADETISVFVPFGLLANGERQDLRLDRLLTMGRVLGRLFVGTRDVSQLMVSAGHATAEKRKGWA